MFGEQTIAQLRTGLKLQTLTQSRILERVQTEPSAIVAIVKRLVLISRLGTQQVFTYIN